MGTENTKTLLDAIAVIQQENRDLKKEMAATIARLRKLEGEKAEDSFCYRFAHAVTALVGLKEAITSGHWFIRGVWAILLLVGTAATIQAMYEIGAEYFAYPTVTSVTFEKRPAYDFPALAFCGDNWIDVEKGLARGLSLDALTYSLGYFTGNDGKSFQNLSQSRREFMDYYRANSFRSLADYYKHVAIDSLIVDSVSEFPNRSTSFFFCNKCLQKPFTKEFIFSSVCYVNRPDPAYPHSASASNLRLIAAVLEDRAKNLVKVSLRWGVYICDNFDVVYPQCRAVTIESPFKSIIQISVSEYRSLDKPNSPCTRELEDKYLAEKCWERCRNKQYKKAVGCDVFWLSSTKKVQDPAEFCNYFDELPNNKSLFELNTEADEGIGPFEKNAQDESCFEMCAYQCDRTAYHLALEAKYNLIDEDTWGLGKLASANPNLSVILVQLRHSAAIDGGVAVWTEMSAFSLSRFVSSIGGTLGLFVGGTVLTLAQIIMFGVNYVIDRNVQTKYHD